ncbi:MAG: UDP-N-acetylmuramate--L-alanine ligase [Eubacterium sp.]|nr:UDP-N-acetylmuramate--L-alanine ligase [Eubacterium sp.]
MYKIDFNNPIHVHFIGIGGISMSGLAEVLLKERFTISGSDSQASALTRELEAGGASIYIGQRASNIQEGTDLVVYTAAIHPDNPEFMQAVALGIPTLSRAELLGQMMDNYARSITVSGTHGKTTTTSMVAHILLAAQADPTISIGGILNAIGGNIRVGSSDLFLTEACEYTNSFFHFYPKYNIILNIEEDHMDFFKDLADIRNSFRRFAQNTSDNGVLILNSEIEAPEEITAGLAAKVVNYGTQGNEDYHATDISYNEFGCASFMANTPAGSFPITLSVPGEHNVSNALSAIAFGCEAGFSKEDITAGLLAFGGTVRRFEVKGHLGNVTVVDDYAHHPTEISATLTAAKNFPHDRIICVFQPHTYTRTKAFWKDFAEALSKADIVVMADVYAARETDTLGVRSEDLANDIAKLGTESYYFAGFDEIENFLLEKCMNNDLLITMGAGDVYKIGENLLGL